MDFSSLTSNDTIPYTPLSPFLSMYYYEPDSTYSTHTFSVFIIKDALVTKASNIDTLHHDYWWSISLS